MLYSNTDRILTDVRCDNNSSIRGLWLGNHRAGSERPVFLPASVVKSYRLKSGIHDGLAIGESRTKCHKIVTSKNDPSTYLLLITKLTDDTGCIGELFAPQGQRLNLITSIRAQGHNQRWGEYILLAYAGDAFFVKWHRPHSTAQRTAFYYIRQDGEILTCSEGSILRRFRDKKLDVAQLPFTVRENPAAQMFVNSLLDLSEWQLVTA